MNISLESIAGNDIGTLSCPRVFQLVPGADGELFSRSGEEDHRDSDTAAQNHYQQGKRKITSHTNSGIRNCYVPSGHEKEKYTERVGDGVVINQGWRPKLSKIAGLSRLKCLRRSSTQKSQAMIKIPLMT